MFKSLFIAFTVFLFALDVAAQTEKINWQTDFRQALNLSRESGKPVLIDFWAAWCEPCRLLDKEFWTRPDVVEAVKSFVPLKLNYDADRNLAKQFGVRGLPYVAVSDSYGSLIASRGGYELIKAADFRQIAEASPKDSASLSKAFARLEVKKDDAAVLLEIAGYYSRNQMPNAAARYYELASRTVEIRGNAAKKESVLANLGRQLYADGSFQSAAYTLEDYLKLFPGGAGKEDVYAILIAAYAKLGKTVEAEKYRRLLKTEFPASKQLK